jgi:hypothetical protein
MLIYHPAHDAYHAIFRALLIVETLQTLELEKLRLLDFYLLFPAELKQVRLPREHASAKKKAEQLFNIYHGPVNGRQTFRDLEPIQLAAIRALAASNLIDHQELEFGHAKRTLTPIPPSLIAPLNLSRERSDVMTDYVLKKFAELPLTGVGGLKERTKLLEYRYDAA